MDSTDFGSVSDFSGVSTSASTPDPAITNIISGAVNSPGWNANAGSGGSGGNMDQNTLFTALAGDATKVGTAFIGASAAKAAVKANPGSVTTLILVAGGVAALILIVVLVKK